MNSGDATVKCRIIVLKSGGHFDYGGFNIGRQNYELVVIVAITDQMIERPDAGNGQGRRTTHTGAGRGLAICDQMKSGGGLKEMDQFRDQLEPFLANQVVNSSELCFKNNFSVARLQNNFAVVASFDAAPGAQRSCKVNRGCLGMKQIQRPDINCAAGQVNAGRC